MKKRKIGVFTIASKNYLAYVRVLFKSVAAMHPEYANYLCLADTIDGAFDPGAETFHIIQSDAIGIPHFVDMTLRYDIMELNTAIKPFMFRWLLNNTDLDSIIYLDPDIQLYSRLDRLETVLDSDVSIVLTPHITHPVEDGKNPNDYHMLQSGVFNLGFAAINRQNEARLFVEWWGRRLETQGSADFSRNLFTDQRWCDLAPCFLDRLHVLKNPGYNVAYWNLAERKIRQIRGEWQANGEPLAFFHFSGIDAGKESVISKHQDRFNWDALPSCKPLFDSYREALVEEGWEQSKSWKYAYAATKEDLPIPAIVRRVYRESFPTSQNIVAANVTEQLLSLCNGISGVVPFDPKSPITRLMDTIYRQRPDLQVTFNLNAHEGRTGFRTWYVSAAFREYNLPPEFIPQVPVVQANTPSSRDQKTIAGVAETGCADLKPPFGRSIAARSTTNLKVEDPVNISSTWARLPISIKRRFAPVVSQILAQSNTQVTLRSLTQNHQTHESKFKPPLTGRIAGLQTPAPLQQFLGDRYISKLMHMVWSSRPDLQRIFDLDTPAGQYDFAGWFEASAQREYGIEGMVPVRNSHDELADNSLFQTTAAPSRPGANLIGYAHAELGMGEHVRMQAAAMDSTPVQFGVYNFKLGVASRQGAFLEHGSFISGNPYAANIFNINADQMLVAYCHLGRDFFANRYNIGYWAWELPNCPAEFLPVMNMVDEIWAGSRFVQAAFAKSASIPVQYMPECVSLPEFKPLKREFFGLRDRAFVFLYTFDFFSFLDRKNPLAAIRAFKLAFPKRSSDVCLVLKVMNGKEESQLWQKMLQLIDGDPRIVIINRTLTRAEVLALFAASDCFVSLHRSEGFGRGPAEAMYLGKPVVVTNYSGNTDFTLENNSCLVDFTLIRVEEGQYPFHSGQEWADADVEHAAWYMKKLYADDLFARDLGARGKEFIHENFNPRIIGARYEARLRKLGLA